MGASGLGETLKEGKGINYLIVLKMSNLFRFFKRDILPKGEKPAFKLVEVRGPERRSSKKSRQSAEHFRFINQNTVSVCVELLVAKVSRQ